MHSYRFVVLVVSSLCLAPGCFNSSGSSDDPRPGAASPPAKAQAPSKTPDDSPSDNADDEDNADEEDSDGLELTWFRGVDKLPADHPCHDSTPVIRVIEHLEREGGESKTRFEYVRETLGELRETLDTGWVHFGPRTVRGVRWRTDNGDFVVATCNMGGLGFEDQEEFVDLSDKGVNATGVKFMIGKVGEPPNLERGSVRWMQRSGRGHWMTLHHRTQYSNDDAGNDPQYIARAELISAEDSDGDHKPEVVAFVLSDRFEWDDEEGEKLCPSLEPHRKCTAFGVDVIVREGDAQLVERVGLRLNGKLTLTHEADKPEAMDDQTFELLATRLERDRDKAVQKARAILREEGKLQ
jgi:hypothetical protein